VARTLLSVFSPEEDKMSYTTSTISLLVSPALGSASSYELLLVLVILLAIAGFFYENISEARDRRFHPMPGRLVDVGGYKCISIAPARELPL
jgi:hypothetical protein